MYNLIKGLLPNIYKTTYIQYLHNLRLILTHLFAAEFYTSMISGHRASAQTQWFLTVVSFLQ